MARFGFLGGELCLDYANTVDWHASAQPSDRLHTYADLVAWGREAGLLNGSAGQQLLAEAERRPALAAAVLAAAVELREVIYRLFVALTAAEPPPEADLAALNAVLPRALGRVRVVVEGDGLAWGWSPLDGALDPMIWPVARSAAELLTSPRLALVRQCEGPGGCGWLFLDTTKNRRRRWCSMDGCGNRAKARRFYERHKTNKGSNAEQRAVRNEERK